MNKESSENNMANSDEVGEKRELLSLHKTVAKFEGLKEHKCLFKTSLCPDRCGHGGTIAIFKIIR